MVVKIYFISLFGVDQQLDNRLKSQAVAVLYFVRIGSRFRLLWRPFICVTIRSS
jgi:hypothetical protein